MERQYEEKKIEKDKEKTSDAYLKELLEKREQYLKKHPHLVPFQKEIDRLLDNAGSQENRMAVLGIMLEGKLSELREQLLGLSSMISNVEK
ncbi:MAG: hypothetical protein PVI90_04395 [Desulfobacteraceae bacterium]|jgi:hypothetical protein